MLLWHIGDAVRKAREAADLSRKELADLAGIRPNTLGELERNVSNFERETLEKVAIALKIEVEGLYALLPKPHGATDVNPVDAETIARFLTLDPATKATVRKVIDQFGLYADRQRPQAEEDPADAPQQHISPKSP